MTNTRYDDPNDPRRDDQRKQKQHGTIVTPTEQQKQQGGRERAPSQDNPNVRRPGQGEDTRREDQQR